MDTKTKELIAIGASIVAKCQPCLEHHLAEARNAGVTDNEIRTAIKIAHMVRKGGDDAMDEFTSKVCGIELKKTAASCCCSGDCT